MALSKEEINNLMKNELYPLSSKYDPDWILQNSIGSHSLWLLEALVKNMNIKNNMHILDIGCGKAAGSIFLAKEFRSRIWAVDLMQSATENYNRAIEMKVSDLVYPLCSDALNLPFPENFFDTIISINSLFFYVSDSEILKNKILRFVKPGGEIGIIVPGFYEDYSNTIPEDLKNVWHSDFYKWHTLDWWKKCFEGTNEVELITADTLPGNEGNEIYNKSAMIYNAHEEPVNIAIKDKATFIRIIARKKKR